MIDAVNAAGFLPFFGNAVPGWSVGDLTDPSLWFSDTEDGPWEWKGPAVQEGGLLYGKLFAGKAGFVSREWIPDLVNWRRNGYDFDARCDDGLVSYKDIGVYETIEREGSLLSTSLKAKCNYRRGGNTGFDTVITRLQMQTYVCVEDFGYRIDKNGNEYGWGVARYGLLENIYGRDYIRSAYDRDPEESGEKILRHIEQITGAPVVDIMKVLGKVK